MRPGHFSQSQPSHCEPFTFGPLTMVGFPCWFSHPNHFRYKGRESRF